jgi:signal transduction histidine kinase
VSDAAPEAGHASVEGTARSTLVESRERSGRRVLGLRGRLLAALLLSSAVTLGAAALALLSPLEHRLRADGQAAVLSAISGSKPEFAEIAIDPATKIPDRRELAATVALLRRRSGAQVTVVDRRLNTIYSPVNQDLDDIPDYKDVTRAFRTHRNVHTLVGDELVATEPMRIGKGGQTYAVVLVRRLQYVSSAVHVVQKAFIEAAAVGLGIALLLALALTGRLLRRLERLREAARQLERRGLDAPMPVDQRSDEIGDLTRAFASMQARLRSQVRARHAFVANASHELRTPLASLDGTLELLEDDLDPERLDLLDARERVLRAREQSRRLSSLASDLLDLSRLDADVELRAEPVELGEICRAVAAEFERRACERDVRIELHRLPQSCWALADPGAVARIVRILLDNAIGITPVGSSVEVSISREGESPQVSVSDSGPGVPEAERELIFERFERGSTSEGRSGFGLGLAIGRELAARMDGSLDLIRDSARDTGGSRGDEGSSGAGGGASFRLSLPPAQVESGES